MKKEIFTDGDEWYIDKNKKNLIPDGTYTIYFTGVRDNYFQILDKTAKIRGFIDDEGYDFTEFVNNLTKLGVTTLIDRMAEKDYCFAQGGYGYGYIKLTDEELKLLENTDYANYINNNVLRLYDVVKSFEYIEDEEEYDAIFDGGYIYINDKNHLLVQNWDNDGIHVYYNADDAKFMKDFIYKVDDSSKFEVYTEYDSIDEFFNSDIEYDDDLDTIEIYVVHMDKPLIKLIKYDTDDSIGYRFIVDITTNNEEQFIVKANIENQAQLNQQIEQTVEALRQYPQFSKYADDLENCL